MSETATIAGPTVKPLGPEHDDAAAAILAACAPDGTIDGGRLLVSAARTDPASSLFGVFVDGELAGVYVMRRAHLMNEIDLVAIAPEHRRRGHGRMCLYDALLRSGRRPLVVEASEATRPIYKAIGFKLVGKRKAADGSPRFRMGWHAPMPDPRNPGKAIC
jgi:ribosomal protein S18 acetylase RimI-like enzyme